MPRKKTKSLQREVLPDRVYGSQLVTRLINKTMIDGKKQTAEKNVYQAMEIAAKKLKKDEPLAVLETALKNVYPQMEVRSRRVGGANYQIPFEVRGTRQIHLGLMWFVESVRARRGTMGKSFAEALAAEIMDAYNETGNAVKKRDDTHRMADANRAFAHFARY
jgi:small subunit ribosomal protein S7